MILSSRYINMEEQLYNSFSEASEVARRMAIQHSVTMSVTCNNALWTVSVLSKTDGIGISSAPVVSEPAMTNVYHPQTEPIPYDDCDDPNYAEEDEEDEEEEDLEDIMEKIQDYNDEVDNYYDEIAFNDEDTESSESGWFYRE